MARDWARGWPRAAACFKVSVACRTLLALREVHHQAGWFALFPYHHLLLADCLFVSCMEFNTARSTAPEPGYTPLGPCRIRQIDPGALALIYLPALVWSGDAPDHPEFLSPARIARHEPPEQHDLLLEPCEAPPPSPCAGLTGDLLLYPPLPNRRPR